MGEISNRLHGQPGTAGGIYLGWMKKPPSPEFRKEYLASREKRAFIEGVLVLLIGAVLVLLALAAVVWGAYFAITRLWMLFW